MIKLNYDGNLEDDIKTANEDFNWHIKSISSIVENEIFSVLTLFGTYAFTNDGMKSIISSASVLGVTSFLTLHRGVKIRKLEKKNKEIANRRLNQFGEFLVKNKIYIDGECLKNSSISNGVVVCNDSSVESVRCFHINTKDYKRRIILSIRDDLVRSINSCRVLARLDVSLDYGYQDDSSSSLYLVEGWELPLVKSKNLALKK